MSEERRKGYPDLIQQIKEVKEKVDKIDITITGNGKPGLNERVRNLETIIEENRKFQASIRGTIIRSAASIVTAVIIAAIVTKIH